jgi:hypothetical protein
MRRTIAVLLFVLALPAPAAAWGSAAHRFIMDRAFTLLPPAVRELFDGRRNELVLRVNDPDLWRVAGWDDGPNHFLDFDEYGAYPFVALPREYDAALEKYGLERLRRNGLLPWRIVEQYGNLRRAFADRQGPYAVGNAVIFGSALAHYIQDATQPLHATTNYDGQSTGNRGVHDRFERDLFERVQARLRIAPGDAVAPLTNPRDAAFETLLSSFQKVDRVMQADRAAANGQTVYDDAYYERFYANIRDVLEERLTAAVRLTAGLIAGAWQQAGL